MLRSKDHEQHKKYWERAQEHAQKAFWVGFFF